MIAFNLKSFPAASLIFSVSIGVNGFLITFSAFIFVIFSAGSFGM